MSFKNTSKNMVAVKNKLLTCSTPEHRSESPSRDSDSVCDSDAASPVPFLCTQDGAEGLTDVVWNFYTPKSEHTSSSRSKNSTPLSRKARKIIKPKVIEKPQPRRRPLRSSQKKTELFQELLELNQNLHELIAKKPQKRISTEKQSGSEEDIFSESGEFSPKSGLRSSRCLRRNVLSSKFGKPEPETALESDDSMNECLLKASQIVEEKILNTEPACKKSRRDIVKRNAQLDNNFNIDQDSMDAIISTITLDSPIVNRVKMIDSPRLNNDSFDNMVGGLNDSAFEQLTQAPTKSSHNWTVKDINIHENSPVMKSPFSRYNSMPESPSLPNLNKPSTSGTVFGRHNSVPLDNNISSGSGDSPIRCTPDEIKKKHQLARERLLAKRLLPFTSTQQSQTQSSTIKIQNSVLQKAKFQPKVPTVPTNISNNSKQNNLTNTSKLKNNELNKPIDIKMIIEKKRQEALMKLRRRQPSSKNV